MRKEIPIASFLSFIRNDQTNRRLAMIGLVGTILQFLIFKWFYPFPDFIPESYIYILTAKEHLNIGILPIGYSKFLEVFHWFTHLDLALGVFQYLFIQTAAMYFFFSFLFLFPLNSTNRNLFFAFLVFNPLSLYLSNYVSSDILFVALSLLWFTQLMWVIHRPKGHQLIAQALLLSLCIALCDNVYYYFLIATVGFCLSMSKLRFKLIGIVTSFLVVLSFALYTRSEAIKVSGTSRLSLNEGWVLANSALYIRQQVVVDSTKLPSEVQELDRIVEDYFKHASNIDFYLSGYRTRFFIVNPASPLRQYFRTHAIEYNPDGPPRWGNVSALFDRYAKWVITNYPLSFLRCYLLPNIGNYLLPPLESLESYNGGKGETEFEAQEWFDYQTPILTYVSTKLQGKILLPFSYLFLIIQVFYVGELIWWVTEKKSIMKKALPSQILLLSACFYIIHFFITVAGGPIIIRQQVFPMIITAAISLLLSEYLAKKRAQ